MQDLFIPHEGNDYKPEALHPKRLILHALAGIAIKIVVIAFLIAQPMSAWLVDDTLVKQGKKIITLTNEIRKNLNLSVLKESDALNQAAFSKAQDMLTEQYFSHLSPSGKGLAFWLSKLKYDYFTAGENLAMGFTDAEEVIEAWKKSETHYANIIDSQFKEIGVGMTGGNYYGIDTAFTAQLFGAPQVFHAAQVNAVKPAAAVTDPAKTKLTIIDPIGQKEKIVSAVAYLAPETTKAAVSFGDHRFDLVKDLSSDKWSGQDVIYEEEAEKNLKPVVPAVISVTDNAGVTAAVDINWENVKPIQPSFFDQYLFLKSHQTKYLKPLFDLSSIYYQLMLTILIIAFLLNIFIEIRKQHPRIILLSLGTITLFVFLVVI